MLKIARAVGAKSLARSCALGIVFCALQASAAITVIAEYRLGEADAGAAVGATVSATTPSIGSTSLAALGAPTYSNQLNLVPRPSRLSVAFNGSDTGLRANSVISTVTDDFGVEAWVRPTAASGITSIVYNGNSATSGWGIYQSGGAYVLLYGGQVLTGPVGSVDLNQWTHLALVRESGETRLYKNGVEIVSTSTGPAIPAGGFAIGANSIPAGPSEFFSGNIDEVRVFTFAAGQFALTDLQTNLSYSDPVPPVPTQSPLALLLAAIALLLAGAYGAHTRARAPRSND